MTVFSTDPIETFSHFFSVLFSAATLNYYVKSKKNQALKEQVDVLSTEVLKDLIACISDVLVPGLGTA